MNWSNVLTNYQLKRDFIISSKTNDCTNRFFSTILFLINVIRFLASIDHPIFSLESSEWIISELQLLDTSPHILESLKRNHGAQSKPDNKSGAAQPVWRLYTNQNFGAFWYLLYLIAKEKSAKTILLQSSKNKFIHSFVQKIKTDFIIK